MCGFAGFFPSISKEKDKILLQLMSKNISFRCENRAINVK